MAIVTDRMSLPICLSGVLHVSVRAGQTASGPPPDSTPVRDCPSGSPSWYAPWSRPSVPSARCSCPPLGYFENSTSAIRASTDLLLQAGQQVTFLAVADLAGVGHATLYRDPDLHAVIDEHRTRQADARTLTGLAHEIAHPRTALEAVADNVRRHEERLRRLERQADQRTG